jgi:RimJ/RimL family protein N-acetyltransferase
MTSDDIRIRVLEPGDEPALEAFLRPHLATSMFLLGNMRLSGLEDTGKPYTGTYVAAMRDGEMVGVVAHFWNGTLMPQVPGSSALLDRLWRAAVAASGRAVRGAIGDEVQACAILDAAGVDVEALRMNHREKLYRLPLSHLIVPEPLAAGDVVARLAGDGDVEVLTDWSVAYEMESMGSQPGPELRQSNRAAVQRGIREGSRWVLVKAGQLVAMTGFNARIPEVVQVGGVYTPPGFRSRGYARCAVAGSLLDARANGAAEAILFTGEHNIPAQKAYESLGFQHIGYFRLSIS